MVTRPQPDGGTVGLVSGNRAGQDGGWATTGDGSGRSAGRDLGFAWRRSATSCPTPSGPADRVPRLGRQGPALPPDRDRAVHHGRAAARVGRPLGEHVRNDLAAMNEPWVAARRPLPGAFVMAEFVAVTATRCRAGEADRGRVGRRRREPVGEVPYAEFMEARVFDSWVHEQDVRRALDRPGGGEPGLGPLARSRAGAMPFVVGKQAACPDGTAVRFEVSVPGATPRLHYRRRGRSRPARGRRGGPVGDPCAVGLDFIRLGCGRVTAGSWGPRWRRR